MDWSDTVCAPDWSSVGQQQDKVMMKMMKTWTDKKLKKIKVSWDVQKMNFQRSDWPLTWHSLS